MGYPPEWDKIEFLEMGRRYEAGEFSIEEFTDYCEAVRPLLWRNQHLMKSPLPPFASAPSTLLECFSLTPGEASAWLRQGRISEALYEQYRQLWRLGAPRFSDFWADTEALPVHPRVAETLVILAARKEKR